MSEGDKPVNTGDGDNQEDKEIFNHPVTGEVISKSAYKKAMKEIDKPKKEKKEKKTAAEAPKEKKEKVTKAPEEVFTDDTEEGQYKNIDKVFPTSYQPKYVEAAWQQWWEKKGFYAPDVAEALKRGEEGKFIMVIPPPNVTGSLHLGHALTTAVEDTLTRWHRMKGKIALWVPGTDHAGIATQSVVEKKLKKDHNLTRHDLGREEFVKKVWEWKTQYGSTITSQIRYLGASVDWSREAFTMDANLSRAVTEAFCRFHESGIIYRSKRLIHWSCALQSAISEIEVDYLDLEGKTFLAVPNHTLKATYEFGTITSFAYKVDGSTTGEELVVATTRLETMLGDTAVAVHPDDPRYTHLHGKFLIHPFVDRKIPIITDGELVDMAFGTGAVKVTPAHDPNDYKCGLRNNLEQIVVLTLDGRINTEVGGMFAGMMRYDARLAMEKELEKLGQLRGKAPNKMRLGLCSRSGDIIEPMLSPQWYVNCSNMAQRAADAVRNKELRIEPDMHESTWFYWLDNIRDWCISRQLWWGHRIPAYFVLFPGEDPLNIDKNSEANANRWIVGRNEEEVRAKAVQALGVTPEAAEELILDQDEDVLDTWFSSGLFPFSVFGWPNNTDDFKAFFPTTLLETGLDILFFWVARMVMMSLQLTDQLPFKTVYLHAMVRDKNGRKMSKSTGNVIDPLEVINGCTLEKLLDKIDEGNLPVKEIAKAKQAQTADFPDGIPECGADALRFGLLAYTVQGRDVNLDIKRVVGYRQFCNKMWNAFKFAMTYVSDFTPSPSMLTDLVAPGSAASSRDRYILSLLNQCITDCNQSLTDYLFGAATSVLHSFFLYEVCDVYLETLKPVFTDTSESNAARRTAAQATLYSVMEHYLRLAHPFMPFVTEELWQRLPNRLTDVESVMVAQYPEANAILKNDEAVSDMFIIKDLVHAGRSLRAEYRVPNNVKADFYVRCTNPATQAVYTAQGDDFCTLAKGNKLQLLSPGENAPKFCCTKVMSDTVSLLVDLEGILDVDAEIKRLSKEVERLNPAIEAINRKMGVEGYKNKVPEEVQVKEAEKLIQLQVELENTITARDQMMSMK